MCNHIEENGTYSEVEPIERIEEYRSKMIKMIDDNVLHKKIVLDKCLLVSKYFIQKGNVELGLNIIRRGVAHDNSKFSKQEFVELVSIISPKTDKCFKDATYTLSEEERKIIERHWKSNRHHPEFYDNQEEMGELDIIEMVCDWAARSQQYGTDLMEFVEERQHNRFKFSDRLFKKIEGYCRLVVQLENAQKAE